MTQTEERERLKEELVAKGIALHDLARRGDPVAVREVHELFKVAHQLDPDDATVTAYYGSALALVGKEAVDPNEKMRCALKGLKLLDQAAKADPDNIAVRILRAHVSYRVPEHFFNRTAIATQDFEYLARRYEEDPSVFSRSTYWEILYHLGKAHQVLEEVEKARAAWERLIKAKPALRWLRLLKAEGMDVGDLSDTESAAHRARLLEEGVALHDRGVNGEKSAAAEALKHFEAAVEEFPDDPLLKAYYGSSVSLVGRYAEEANAAFAAAIKGMKIIDEAVKAAPDDVQVRLVRARHSLRLPELFFRRTAVAIVDLEFIRERVAQGDGAASSDEPPASGDSAPPSTAALSKEELLEVLWMLGEAYYRLGVLEDAKAAWNALLKEDPEGTYRALVEARLAPEEAGVAVAEVDLNDKQAVLREGIRLHDLGVQGNRAAVPKALELIRRAYELDPDDPVTRAYYGSAIALSVRESGDTTATFSKVIQGMIQLNTAAKLAPENETVRRLRAYLCFRLPESMFHLTKTAIEDFEFLRKAEMAKSSPDAAALRRILTDLAAAYRRVGRDDDARAVEQELEGMNHGVS